LVWRAADILTIVLTSECWVAREVSIFSAVGRADELRDKRLAVEEILRSAIMTK
jgi:hypothetical protein